MFEFAEDRDAALRNWARHDLHATAAVELLIDHRHWPAMLDRAGLIRRFPAPEDDYARPLLAEALERLDDPNDHDMYCSSSELRILQIAASLVAGTPVALSNVLVNLDRSNQRRVVKAVSRAVGLAEWEPTR